jgi:hypothetical protein
VSSLEEALEIPVELEDPSELSDRRRRSLGAEISRRLRARKVRTPDRALAEIEKLETAGLEEVGVAVTVRPVHLRRTTGFEVSCEEHGSMPVYAPSMRAGHLAAARHVLHEHGRRGTVVLSWKARRS